MHLKPISPADWRLLRTARLTALGDSPEAFGSTPARALTFDEATCGLGHRGPVGTS